MGGIPVCKVYAVMMMLLLRRRMEVRERHARTGKGVAGRKNNKGLVGVGWVGVARIAGRKEVGGTAREPRKPRGTRRMEERANGNGNGNTDKEDSPLLAEGKYVKKKKKKKEQRLNSVSKLQLKWRWKWKLDWELWLMLDWNKVNAHKG